nr:hypothetical protein [Tanacetum cinerariifolium]
MPQRLRTPASLTTSLHCDITFTHQWDQSKTDHEYSKNTPILRGSYNLTKDNMTYKQSIDDEISLDKASHGMLNLQMSDLDTMSLDDLYNHLKVYESEVQKKSESNSQNVAFISSAKHSSRNEEVNTASVSTASANIGAARKKITIQGTDVAGFDKSKDWSYMANDEENHTLVADEEAPTEFALMAKTSAESKDCSAIFSAVASFFFWQWELSSLAVGTSSDSENSITGSGKALCILFPTKMKIEALKEHTTTSRPIKALTVYPPNTPAMLVPRSVYVAMNSELNVARFTEMHVANTIVEARCLKLKAGLSNLRDESHNDNHNELVNQFSNLKKNASFPSRKGQRHKQLKMKISHLQETCSEAVRTLDYRAFDSQITQLTEKVTVLQAQNDLFRAENEKIKQQYKELYDSIKITRAKHIEQELLEYAIGTCPQDSHQRDKKHAPAFLIRRKKHVTFAKQCDTSNSDTHKHVAKLNTQKTNVPMPPSTGVNRCADASGSQPRSNTQKNRISPVVEEESEMSLELLRFTRQQLLEYQQE